MQYNIKKTNYKLIYFRYGFFKIQICIDFSLLYYILYSGLFYISSFHFIQVGEFIILLEFDIYGICSFFFFLNKHLWI